MNRRRAKLVVVEKPSDLATQMIANFVKGPWRWPYDKISTFGITAHNCRLGISVTSQKLKNH
jgi:hypothetical protein